MVDSIESWVIWLFFFISEFPLRRTLLLLVPLNPLFYLTQCDGGLSCWPARTLSLLLHSACVTKQFDVSAFLSVDTAASFAFLSFSLSLSSFLYCIALAFLLVLCLDNLCILLAASSPLSHSNFLIQVVHLYSLLRRSIRLTLHPSSSSCACGVSSSPLLSGVCMPGFFVSCDLLPLIKY